MSPEVWDDACPRIQSVCTSLNIPLVLPNEDSNEINDGSPSPWVDVEVSAQATSAIELGGKLWDEQGTIWLHLMIPVGTGIRDGLVMRKTLASAFRDVTDRAIGLTYRDSMGMDPMGPGTDDGMYRRLTLLVRYHYQDLTS